MVMVVYYLVPSVALVSFLSLVSVAFLFYEEKINGQAQEIVKEYASKRLLNKFFYGIIFK